MASDSTEEKSPKRSDMFRHVCHFCGDEWEAYSYYSSCKKCETLGELQVNRYVLERAEKHTWAIGQPEVQALARFIQNLQLD